MKTLCLIAQLCLLFLLNSKLPLVNAALTWAENLTVTDLENNVLYLSAKVRKLQQLEKQQSHTDVGLKADISSVFATLHALLQQGNTIQSQGNSETKISPNTVTDCGGVVVSPKGYLVFRSNMDHSERRTCTWTIRANTAEKVAIKVLSDNFPEEKNVASLGIIPLKGMMRDNVTQEDDMWIQTTIASGDRNEYLLDGSVIFVWLEVNASANVHFQPSFVLHFEGRGKDAELVDVTFSHFHYNSKSGSVSYPFNGQDYAAANQIATFTINPSRCELCLDGISSFEIGYLSVENSANCEKDYLSTWGGKLGSKYVQWGPSKSHQRHCGRYDADRDEVLGDGHTERWIAFFVSDSNGTGKGFQFSWNM